MVARGVLRAGPRAGLLAPISPVLFAAAAARVVDPHPLARAVVTRLIPEVAATTTEAPTLAVDRIITHRVAQAVLRTGARAGNRMAAGDEAGRVKVDQVRMTATKAAGNNHPAIPDGISGSLTSGCLPFRLS